MGGQRQLICIGRAILRSTKVMLLDEATANVDSATDAVIQQVLRTTFEGMTSITIAHRLDTVADADAIATFSHGRVVEFDAPNVLLERPGSMFKALVEELGPEGASKVRAAASKCRKVS